MKKKRPSLDALNQAYGLDYWSNRINAWEDFPSMVGTITGWAVNSASSSASS